MRYYYSFNNDEFIMIREYVLKIKSVEISSLNFAVLFIALKVI